MNKNESPKIVFMGTPLFANVALNKLLQSNFKVVAVVTSPDKPVGRGGKIRESVVSETAKCHGIVTLKPKTKNELAELLKNIKYDLIVVAAYGMIIPESILESASLGSYNIHASILPKYRGASPISAAILAGDKEAGVTIMKMSAGMDEGDIVAIDKIPVGPTDTTESLTAKLAEVGANLLIETLPKIVEGKAIFTPQVKEMATYCSLIRKEEGNIDWSKDADLIERQVRAFHPWPSAYTEISGKRVKILQANIVDSINNLEPGTVKTEDGHLFIGCHDSALEVTSLQPEGKKPMTAKEFLNGTKF